MVVVVEVEVVGGEEVEGACFFFWGRRWKKGSSLFFFRE